MSQTNAIATPKLRTLDNPTVIIVARASRRRQLAGEPRSAGMIRIDGQWYRPLECGADFTHYKNQLTTVRIICDPKDPRTGVGDLGITLKRAVASRWLLETGRLTWTFTLAGDTHMRATARTWRFTLPSIDARVDP